MALTKDRSTPRREGDTITMAVAASTRIYAGSLVARNASGYAVAGSVSSSQRGVGRAEEQVDNTSGSAGDLSVTVRKGVLRFLSAGGGDSVTIAHIGETCYIDDDQSVASNDGTGSRGVAGTVFDVDADGVWVRFD